jgi:hypothetical protein
VEAFFVLHGGGFGREVCPRRSTRAASAVAADFGSRFLTLFGLGSFSMGKVINFEERAVASLRARCVAAEEANQDLIAFARGHSGAVASIHEAVLAAVEAEGFDHLITSSRRIGRRSSASMRWRWLFMSATRACGPMLRASSSSIPA